VDYLFVGNSISDLVISFSVFASLVASSNNLFGEIDKEIIKSGLLEKLFHGRFGIFVGNSLDNTTNSVLVFAFIIGWWSFCSTALLLLIVEVYRLDIIEIIEDFNIARVEFVQIGTCHLTKLGMFFNNYGLKLAENSSAKHHVSLCKIPSFAVSIRFAASSSHSSYNL
jgi:hypothetical protein